MKKFSDLKAEAQWGLLVGTYMVATVAFTFGLAAFVRQPEKVVATAREPAPTERPAAPEQPPPDPPAGRALDDQAPALLTSARVPKAAPAPAESAPTAEPAPKPAAEVVFAAEVATSLRGLVSYRVSGPKAKEAETAFDQLINAVADGKLESAKAPERIYSRKTRDGQLKQVVVFSDFVGVEFESNASSEQLDRITDPIKSLAKACGFTAAGPWTGEGLRRSLAFQTPSGIPEGTMK